MTLTHIIFDWDGTLARTLDLWLMGYQRAFAQRDMHLDADHIVSEFFHNHHEVTLKYPDLGFPQIASETLEYVRRNAAQVTLYEDALLALDTLRAGGYATSLVSSSARGVLETGMNAHGLAPRFASTVAGDDGFGHKPDTRPFRETMQRMGKSPEETVVIGDSQVDILAGKALGCTTCLFAPQPNRRFHDFDHILSTGPDYVVENWTGFLELLQGQTTDAGGIAC